MAKKQINAKKTGNIGMGILKVLLNQQNCSLHETTSDEVGIDGFVELFKNNESLAKVIAIQSKCTLNLKIDNLPVSKLNVAREDLEYWNALNLPVIIFFTNPNSNVAYFISSLNIVKPLKKTNRIQIPTESLQKFDESAVDYFAELAAAPSQMIRSIPSLANALQKIFADIDPYFTPVVHIESGRTTYAFKPKTPDAFIKSPQNFSFSVDFSDEKFRKQYKRFHESGEALAIDQGSFIMKEIPSMMVKLGERPEDVQAIFLTPAYRLDEKYFFELRFINSDIKGSQFPIVFHIIRKGTKEFTFSNLQEKRPFVIELRIPIDGSSIGSSIRFNPWGFHVNEVDDALNDLQKFKGMDQMHLYDKVRQTTLLKLKYTLPESFLRILEHDRLICSTLLKAQTIFQQNLVYPITKFSEEDLSIISDLNEVFSTGLSPIAPEHYTIHAPKDKAVKLLEGARSGNAITALRKFEEITWEVQFLGAKRRLSFFEGYEYLEVAKVDYIRGIELLSNPDLNSDSELSLPIIPLENTRAMYVFPEWLCDDDKKIFEGIKQHVQFAKDF